MGITPYALAKSIFLDPPRIAAIIKRKRKITDVTTLRFARLFGNSAAFWMTMQSRHDFETNIEEIVKDLSRISQFHLAS